MLVPVSRSHRWVFWLAVSIHVVWGTSLLLSADPEGVTGLHVLATLVPEHHVLGGLILIVAVLGGIGASRLARGIIGAVFLTFQQVALWVSACGAIYYVWSQQYADGVTRSLAFMLPDQWPLTALAVVHTLALLHYYRRNLWSPR